MEARAAGQVAAPAQGHALAPHGFYGVECERAPRPARRCVSCELAWCSARPLGLFFFRSISNTKLIYIFPTKPGGDAQGMRALFDLIKEVAAQGGWPTDEAAVEAAVEDDE